MQQLPWLAAGRYEVGEMVGQGGYGMVCRGVDRHTGQRVALKMLSPEAGRDANVVERMLREQQALVALSGTCAVTAIDLCRLESGAPCLVMEWLEGCDLEQQLSAWEAAGQRGSVQHLLEILQPLTQTLERAHQIGIVHRDIKPANIFLTPGSAPGVKLLDFGLSRMKSAAPLTAFGMVMGSPSYIAPETWRGNSAALDGRADLFALAVIVFRWLGGKLPFDSQDLIGKMTAVTSGPRPSIAPLRADLPPAVDAWMSRALAVEPADRFQTGGELYSAFSAALRGEAWPQVSADASGVRSAANPPAAVDTGERQSTLAGAWRAAASLLKRFTAPRDRETPVATPPLASSPPVSAPAVAAPSPKPAGEEPGAQPVVSGPKTLWLPSEELQDAVQPVVSGPKTLWLPSEELQDAVQPVVSGPKTLWLPSEELQDVVHQPAAPAEPKAKAKAKANKRFLKPKAKTKTKAKSKKQARKAPLRPRKA
jgi:serine/threonine protein kinase